MKKSNNHPILFTVLLLCVALTARAQHYVPNAKNSRVEFRVYNHKGGGNNIVRGLFTNISGNIIFDPKQLDKASFDVAVTPGSVSTDNHERDNDLKSEHFFAAAKFPEIRIKSTKVKADGSVVYILYGNLSMKGITKPVKIQFTATQTKDGGYLFRGSFELSRSMYGVGESGGDVDDRVTVFVELRTEKK